MSVGAMLFRLRALLALAVLLGVFSLLSPAFLTTANLTILVKHVAINAIMAVGMTFVILSGGIDLSVGSIAGLAGMIAGGLIDHGLVLRWAGVVVYFQIWLVVLIALLVGAVAGGLNGLLVSRLNVAPFIATLGSMYVARGAALLLSGGATFPNLAGKAELGNTGFPAIGSASILAIPVPIWIMIFLAGDDIDQQLDALDAYAGELRGPLIAANRVDMTAERRPRGHKGAGGGERDHDPDGNRYRQDGRGPDRRKARVAEIRLARQVRKGGAVGEQ